MSSLSKQWLQYIPSRSEMTSDEMWMCEALKEASIAYTKGEVPVGAVVVFDNRLIGRGHNQVELLQDATAHAEMLAIGAASEYLSSWRLERCTLYITLEPCAMCAGAILLSRVQRVVWAAPDIRHGANGSLFDLFHLPHPTHSCAISSGVLEEASAILIKQFFKERRVRE